jgi:hypothetical protein
VTYLGLFLWLLAYPPLAMMTDNTTGLIRAGAFAIMTVGLIRFAMVLIMRSNR